MNNVANNVFLLLHFQLLIQEGVVTADLQTAAEHHLFKPQQPREKWINKRTAIKTKVMGFKTCLNLWQVCSAT